MRSSAKAASTSMSKTSSPKPALRRAPIVKRLNDIIVVIALYKVDFLPVPLEPGDLLAVVCLSRMLQDGSLTGVFWAVSF